MVSVPAKGVPRTIPKDKIESLGASSNVAAIRSSEPAYLDTFDVTCIRIAIGPKTEPLTNAERSIELTKRLAVVPSIRASALMFLTHTYNYEKKARIIIVTRQPPGIVGSIVSDLQILYPRATFVVHAADAVDRLYEMIKSGATDHSPPDEHTYLFSLGTTCTHHRDIVRYFRPNVALMGIELTGQQSFQFYDGELWIPPFGGSSTRVVYLRVDLDGYDIEEDPILRGSVWSGIDIANALERFKFVTNESVAYINPITGTDTYFFSEFPNDYSHLFAYTAAVQYYQGLGKNPTIDDFEVVFRMVVRHI